MKKYLVIFATLLALTSKAQTSKDTVRLPAPVAKKIAKELVECDGIKEDYILTKEQLRLSEDKVLAQSAMITNYATNESLLNTICFWHSNRTSTLIYHSSFLA